MKDFFNSISSLFGVILITFITSIATALFTENIILSLLITASIFILSFIGLIKQSYTESIHN